MVNYLDGTLNALAEPNRRAVVDLLRAGPKRAGDLAEAIEASGPAASRHLRTLERSGLVDVVPDPDDARARVYRLKPERFEELSAWLDQVREFWTLQLASFKDYAERHAGMYAAPTQRDGPRRRRPTRRLQKGRRKR